MLSTLLVFDIDGTLISTRAGRYAFNRAFQRVFGLQNAAATIVMAGRTDPAIFNEVCAQNGLDPAAFGAWKLEFLAELAGAVRADPGFTLPGVQELVAACTSEPGFTLALGTGNVEEGARTKLAPHDLNRHFATGGFGTDGVTRDEVIARAILRAEELQGSPFERVLVIGDTPYDISCGKTNRCLTVGVATGPFSRVELAECRPDLVLENFSNVAGVMNELRLLR